MNHTIPSRFCKLSCFAREVLSRVPLVWNHGLLWIGQRGTKLTELPDYPYLMAAGLGNRQNSNKIHGIHGFLSVAVATGTFATPGVALLPPGCCSFPAALLSESTTSREVRGQDSSRGYRNTVDPKWFQNDPIKDHFWCRLFSLDFRWPYFRGWLSWLEGSNCVGL